MRLYDVNTHPVPADAKWAFTTRRVDRTHIASFSTGFANAVPGDLVLGRIIEIGQHKKIQLSSGRLSESLVGDHVVLAVGDRYAPDQFEGIAEIDAEGADLIASGGILGKVREAHGKMSKATKVKPIGLLTDAIGEVLNVAAYALKGRAIPEDVTVIGVFGTSMNSGKTTAAASLAHGLMRAGRRVCGVKATGTGAFGDYNAFRDAGVPVRDFTDAGMATTYKMPIDRIESGFESLVAAAAAEGAEIVVVEFADGVFQTETNMILTDSYIRERLDATVFASGDAAGAFGGVSVMRSLGVNPIAVSGLLSCSPLASREAATALGLPVLTRDALRAPEQVMEIVTPVLRTSGEILPEAA